MTDLISLISNWALGVIDQSGYTGVFLFSIADRLAFQFIPGELVFSILGFLISQGRFNFIPALILTVLGNLVGDSFIYLASLKSGRKLVEKFGRYFFVSNHELEHVERLFEKHGGKLIFWGRFVPAVVTFISIPAGLAKMNFKKFFIYTILGSLPRNFILIFLGFNLGENWTIIIEFLEKGQSIMILLLAGVVILYIIRHIRKQHLTHK